MPSSVPDLLADLDSGTADVVLARCIPGCLAAIWPSRWSRSDWSSLPARPARHPARAATLGAFHGEPFACLPAGSGLRAILLAAAAAEGLAPRIQFGADTPANIREFVAAGLGVALLAETVASGPGPAVRVHSLRPEPEHPPIGVIAVRGQTPSPAAAGLAAAPRALPTSRVGSCRRGGRAADAARVAGAADAARRRGRPPADAVRRGEEERNGT